MLKLTNSGKSLVTLNRALKSGEPLIIKPNSSELVGKSSITEEFATLVKSFSFLSLSEASAKDEKQRDKESKKAAEEKERAEAEARAEEEAKELAKLKAEEEEAELARLLAEEQAKEAEADSKEDTGN